MTRQQAFVIQPFSLGLKENDQVSLNAFLDQEYFPSALLNWISRPFPFRAKWTKSLDERENSFVKSIVQCST